MAANILETDNMFSVRQPVWHGLGVIISEAPTSADALRIAGLDWEVKMGEALLQTQDGKIIQTGRKYTYRDSDNMPLGMVSGQYSIVQNKEAFEFTDELIGTGEVTYETAGSLDNGKKVWMLANLPETSILGDATVPYLLFSNSHDGSSSVRVTATPVRVVCQNTLNFALAGAKRIWSFTHRGDIGEKIHEAQVTLKNMKEYMTGFSKEAERMAQVKVSGQQLQDFLNMMFPVDEDDEYTKRRTKNMIYLREMFMNRYNVDDLGNFRGTAWGLLNAASDFTSHVRPLRLTATHQEKVMASFMNGNAVIDKTYDFINDALAA